ncbi:MAG: hypothetical protein F9K24_20320 [Leptonema illini]|jgi:hypothetical protein|uniref:Uncharacterized protein n=1 Tax=Leptonema illini TaxID=183 RepID=A0A833LVP0_9LEPT|nr:MAG: hypothetical protein F9K24_20320 [Leptonema illini]
MKRINFFLLTLLMGVWGCYTPPIVQMSDTSVEQKRVSEVEKSLRQFPKDTIVSNLGPQDLAAIQEARRALTACAETLKKKDEQINACATQLNDLGQNYTAQSQKLSALQKEVNGSWFEKIGIRFVWGIGGLIAGFIGAILLGVALYFTGSITKIAAMVRLP